MSFIRFCRQVDIRKFLLSSIFLFLIPGINAFSDVNKNSLPITVRGNIEQHIEADKQEFYFDLTPQQAMLVTVRSSNSQLTLALFNQGEQLIHSLQIPDRTLGFMDIIVKPNDCNRCRLKITATGKVDTGSRFTTRFEILDNQANYKKLDAYSRLSNLINRWPQAMARTGLFNGLYSSAFKLAQQAQVSNIPEIMQQGFLLAAVAAHELDDNKREILALKQILRNKPSIDFALRAFYKLGSVYYRQGKWRTARAMLNKVLKAGASTQPFISGLAYSRLGNLDDKLGYPARAGRDFARAIRIFEKNSDHFFMLATLLNQGWVNFRTGNIAQAFSDYQLVASLSAQYEVPRFEADARVKLARIYARMGDIDQALVFIDQSIDISQHEMDTHLKGFYRARSLQAKGIILIDYGMYESAIDALNEAKKLYQHYAMPVDVVDVSYLLGKSYYDSGDFETANNLFQQTLQFDLKNDNPENIAQTYNLLARVAFQQGEDEDQNEARSKALSRADRYQQRAFEYYKKIDGQIQDSNILSRAALIAFYNDRIQASEQYLQQAIAVSKKGAESYALNELDYRKARLKALKGNRETAMSVLSRLHDRVEQESQHITRQDVKRAYLALQQKISAFHIGLLYQQQANPAKSLEIAERYRSRTLNETVARIKRNDSLSSKHLAKRLTLQKRLNKMARDYYVSAKENPGHQSSYALRRVAEKLQTLEAEVNRSRLSTADNTEKSIASIIAKLPVGLKANQAILYYDINRAQSFYWLISRQGISQHVLPGEKEIKKRVQAVLDWAAHSPHQQSLEQLKTGQESLRQLSDILLGDNADLWRQYSDLVIVPDRSLNYLPFSLLHLPGSDQYLAQISNISYAPSLMMYRRFKQDKQPSQVQKMLIVADPAMKPSTVKVASVALRGGFALSELPYTGLEAEKIQKTRHHRVDLLMRDAASKQQFLGLSLNDYGIVHFAMHGLSNTHIPSLGGLVFSNQGSDDNLLLATEIARLPLNAELVVLSGCETGIGKNINGEGLLGLSRAFFEAGVQRVLASLWSVQDDATAELMSAFYSNLQQKQKPSQALRNARLHVANFQRAGDVRKRWRHPFYWAGFVLQGEADGQLD